MKKTKRIISLFLAVLLLGLTACSNGGGKDTEKSTDTDIQAANFPAGIAPNNYGETFNIVYPDISTYKEYLWAEENDGDVMHKALFDREVFVEDHLGVDIMYSKLRGIGDINPAVELSVNSGDDTYQMVLTHCYQGINAMITSNLLLDLNELPSIDFTADWWNHDSITNLSIYGKQFIASSDYIISDPNVILFNKKMIEDNKLEDPYQLVRDGKWTIDKMREMSTVITKENGDTKWDFKDTYGFSTPRSFYLTSFMYGFGIFVFQKNADTGTFDFVFQNERTYKGSDTMYDFLFSNDAFVYDTYADTTPNSYGGLNITTGRCLFNVFASSNLISIRGAEVDYGILPFPKLDEVQNRYYSFDYQGFICVPNSVDEDEAYMVGDVIELLSYKSDEVKNTYFDIVLDEKFARDDESKEMLNIIFDTLTFDPGFNYSTTSELSNLFSNLYSNYGRVNASTIIERNKGSAMALMEKFEYQVNYILGEGMKK